MIDDINFKNCGYGKEIQVDFIEVLKELHEKSKLIEINALKEICLCTKGILSYETNNLIQFLKRKGEIYEPNEGFIKIL